MERSSSDAGSSGGATAPWTTDCAEAVARGEGLHLDVYVRSVEPKYGTREYRRRVMDGVSDLAAEGTVDGYDVHVWGDRLELGGGSAHGGDLEGFRRWAGEQGATLPFEVRECHSRIVDEEFSVLVPPCVLVAVSREDGLVGVVPCREPDRTTSVADLLALLAEPDGVDDRRASAST